MDFDFSTFLGGYVGGGTLLKSYDFSTNGQPTDPDFFPYTTADGTIDYSSGTFHASIAAKTGSSSPAGASIGLLSDNVVGEIYIEFMARLPGPNRHGFKFCKLFGVDTGNNYANTTFGLVYTNGNMQQTSFGDGSGTQNDTSHVIDLSGTGHFLGRSPSPTILTPQAAHWTATEWGTDWHTFRLRHKYNTGNSAETEQPDGEFYVEIDGQVYVNASGLFNRHWSNSRQYDHVGIGGVVQGTTSAFTFDYDNIKISTGGWV